MAAHSLLDLTATANPREVVVSAVLLSSMALITEAKAAFHKDGVIIRVYADLIEPDDDRNALTNRFTVTVPRSEDVRVLYAGEKGRTVGRLFGVPVRVPRRDDSAAKIPGTPDARSPLAARPFASSRARLSPADLPDAEEGTGMRRESTRPRVFSSPRA